MPRDLNTKGSLERDAVLTPPEQLRVLVTRGRSGARVRRRATPESLTLWRDVLDLEERIRPEAFRALLAERRIPHPMALAAALVLVVVGVVAWAIQVQRLEDLARLELVGRNIEVTEYVSFLTLERVALAWAPITGALAAGVALTLILLAIPSTRRFTMRHPIFPVAIGAALVLGTLQLII